MMGLQSTRWFPLDGCTPVREGWYEVRLANGETAFAKYAVNGWSETPPVVFTHWRGLASDPARSPDVETFDAAATAAVGVRAAWNAFFPGLGDGHPVHPVAHKPPLSESMQKRIRR
ncbi:hypothetical protein [Paraburkholderia sp. J67]|uniref:hypothetical protein n=1 Tax=Paraburkholderia sp. J67 TaxID=2805435 RepID=UPI002ABD7A4B|nr:hypothetical protein [Paraburkholderia sp. J67]